MKAKDKLIRDINFKYAIHDWEKAALLNGQ
jgi:hypothetical protein